MKKLIVTLLTLVVVLSYPGIVSASGLTARPESTIEETTPKVWENDVASISMESGSTYVMKKDYYRNILPSVYLRKDNKDTEILTLKDVVKSVGSVLAVDIEKNTTKFIAVKYDPKSKLVYAISQLTKKGTVDYYLAVTNILTKTTIISSQYSDKAQIDSSGEIVVTDVFTQTQIKYSINTSRFIEPIGNIQAGSKALWVQNGFLFIGDLYGLAMDLNTGDIFQSPYSKSRAMTYFDINTGFVWWLDNTKSDTNMYNELIDINGNIKYHYRDFKEMYRLGNKVYAISAYNELCEIIPQDERTEFGYKAKVKLIQDFSKTKIFDRDLNHNYQLTLNSAGDLIIYTEWDGKFTTIK